MALVSQVLTGPFFSQYTSTQGTETHPAHLQYTCHHEAACPIHFPIRRWHSVPWHDVVAHFLCLAPCAHQTSSSQSSSPTHSHQCPAQSSPRVPSGFLPGAHPDNACLLHHSHLNHIGDFRVTLINDAKAGSIDSIWWGWCVYVCGGGNQPYCSPSHSTVP